MSELTIIVEDHPSQDTIRTVINNLIEYNNLSQAEKDIYQPLTILLRNDHGEIVAGLLGKTQWRWLFISHLWVAESLRRQGYGSKIMLKAEEVAKQRNCSHIYLDTFSFQAQGFYERLGYEIFGVLADFPPGHQRYFFKKDI